MFGARETDGKWHLCVKRGKSIRNINMDTGDTEVEFPTAAKARECAKELNDKYWTEYSYYMNTHPSYEICEQMKETIEKWME